MPGLLSSSEDLAFMARVTTGDQVDTPITPILTGIAGSGGTATGAIGRAGRIALSAVVRRLPDEG
jgi:hypothetical protein